MPGQMVGEETETLNDAGPVTLTWSRKLPMAELPPDQYNGVNISRYVPVVDAVNVTQ